MLADDIFQSAFSSSRGVFSLDLGDSSPSNHRRCIVHLPTNLSTFSDFGTVFDEAGEEDEVMAPGVSFPMAQLVVENCFHNRQEKLKDEGYNSKGNLLHFSDTEGDNIEEYDEVCIVPTAAPAPVSVVPLTVEAVGRRMSKCG